MRRFQLFTLLIFAVVGQNAFSKSLGAVKFELCATCHGTEGEGNQSLAAPAIAGQPSWYLKAQLEKFKSGARGAHYKDAPGLKMRPIARSMKVENIDVIADYVAKLPRPKLALTVKAHPIRGEKKYKEVCIACHGADAMGNKALNAPPLKGTNDWYILTQLRNFKAGIRGNNASKDPIGASMAPMASLLEDETMADIVSYIQAL